MDSLLARWRADTPGVAHRAHFNNASAALMPAPVHAAIRAHLDLELRLGGYEAAAAVEDRIAAAYAHLGTLLGAAPNNLALVENATVGFAQALSAFDFAPGDVIVTSRNDYISSQLAFLALRERQGVEVRLAEELPEGGVDPESVRALLRTERCRLVTLSWVPTNSGLVQDAVAVGAVCESAGVPYLVDACQAVGQFPVDVGALRCDYLSGTARKFLRGPRGIGFLYVSDQALARGDYPLLVDMRGAEWTGPEAFRPVAGARRFENWEFAYALVLGLGEAARYALAAGPEVTAEHTRAVAARLREALSAIPGVALHDRGSAPCAIVTFTVRGREAGAVARRLADARINVNVSLRAYAIHDMDAKGIPAAVRASPHYYNSDDEVDRLAALVAELAGG
jgi:selenocysteine lyase/cysteine desulfurase